MSHRTQVTLTDEQYERLMRQSARSGVGLAELVRRAVDRCYGATPRDEAVRALDESFKAWSGRDFDGEDYVERLRRGMARRLTGESDTYVLTDHLRGVESAREALRGAVGGGELLAASVLTRVELLAGMRDAEAPATQALLDTLQWIVVDEQFADRAGRLANQ